VKRNQIIILASFAGGVALLCFLSWQFLFQAIRKDINDQELQLDAAIKELDEAKSKAAQHEKFLAEAENVRRGVNFVSSRLDPRFSQPEIAQLFNKARFGLPIMNIEILPDYKIAVSKDYPGLSESELKVKLTCDYHTVGEYINKVISQKRIVNLTELKIDPNDATGRKGVLLATLTFKVYLKTPSPETGN
jgi:Tfp pilus assembly protein PilO